MFTEEQVIFECNNESFCEQDQEGARRSGLGYLPEFSFDARTLLLHIQSYASRELTHQSDILDGMKGVLRFFATNTDPQHQHWGLPVSGGER